MSSEGSLFAGQVTPMILYINEISHHQVCHSASLECGYFFFFFDKMTPDSLVPPLALNRFDIPQSVTVRIECDF